MKHVDLCDIYDSRVQQSKQSNPPPNSYIVTLLKFINRNVSACCSCGGKFYNQGYPDAPRHLIVVSKSRRVFINPVSHERTQSNEFSKVFFHFNLNKNKTLKCVLKKCMLSYCIQQVQCCEDLIGIETKCCLQEQCMHLFGKHPEAL